MTGYVYRIYSKYEELLYVGSSTNWKERLNQHRREGAKWWPHYHRHTIVEYPTYDEAKASETTAIAVERPTYNRNSRKQGWTGGDYNPNGTLPANWNEKRTTNPDWQPRNWRVY
jgi:predicted GIY-YIG superfamily endonuclease